MDSEAAAAASHKRSKSAVSRALQRISSRGDVPTLSPSAEQDGSAVSSPVDSPSGSGNTTYLVPSGRMSMQASRPHLATTMSHNNSSHIGSRDIDSSSQQPSNGTQGASIEQSVRLFKVFEVLRSGDTTAIAAVTKGEENRLEGTTVLHLAIQCAEQHVIEHVLALPETVINAKDRDGNTALHVAAMLGRAPVVRLLLQQDSTSDAIVNHQGKTALDLTRNPDIFQQLQLARSVFVESNVRKVHELVAAGSYEQLERLLSDPRVRAVLDVNSPELATDTATTEYGGTLLHEAARKKNIKLAQLLLLNGADPFRRDRKGKLPQDVTKDDRTRAILKKSPAAQAAQRSIQEKTILGDIAQAPSAESGVAGKDSREIKGYLRKWTNYTSGYKLRWFVLEDGVLSYYKHQDDAGSACRGAINMRIAKLHMDAKDKLLFEIHGKSSVKYILKANHQVEAKRWFWALNNAIQWAKDEAKEEQKKQQHLQETIALRDARHEQIERLRTRDTEYAHAAVDSVPGMAIVSGAAATSTQFGGSTVGEQMSGYGGSEADVLSLRRGRANNAFDGDNDDEDEYGDDASSHEVRPTNKDAFSITAQSAKLQLDLLAQVSGALQDKTKANPNMLVSDTVVEQALASYDMAVGNLRSLLVDLVRLSRDHEAYWLYRLDREQNIRRLWEDSMAKVAKEQEEMEQRIGESEDKRKRTKRALKDALEGGVAAGEVSQQTELVAELPQIERARRMTISDFTNNEVSDDETEDEEEFFDAIGTGQVEVVESLPPTSPPAVAEDPTTQQLESSEDTDDPRAREIAKSFKGYEDGIRKRLKIDADNRPRVSLWGILKGMIGKDMTKMTLPVTFNEPTSLLYRAVEDMECAEMLNMAADRSDSCERLVIIAGFAASEYASTIGRVAKPFNPLLGETYELCRPDIGYRYFIEQVSHHPPIGAAYAESPKWTYYGESAVKSRFYGKSFEFNPLGTWFLHLRTPGGGEEMYTWKKVTSSVVGIITGNPTVDNYGPMEVRNWTTGEVAYLDFKPKGWKASSAYQVSGKVVGADGKTRWSLGGRWNDKIYARYTPGFEENPDSADQSSKPDSSQAVLVWEANPRPTGIPFNLTPFVVTLNALPDRLRPFLAPTDSRLRPDQRAMEEGEYDLAAVEKNRVEEGQRARRRAREAKGEEFVPRWFSKAKHPITGEDYWLFNHDYWVVREDVANGERKWADAGLEDIF